MNHETSLNLKVILLKKAVLGQKELTLSEILK